MANFVKFKKLRIDLEEVYAFSAYESGTREKGYVDKLLIYTKPKRGDSFEVYYDTIKDRSGFEEAVAMLDELFEVKSEQVSKILP